MAQRTAVVTGGASGLGAAVAAALAGQGCHTVLLARDAARGARARDGLRAASGAPVDLVVGDLSTPASTRAAAHALLEACPRLDVLVHNAGLWPSRLEVDDDGNERAFAVNHLAPFLLNALLEQRLADSSARVVQVSAGLYVKGRAEVARTRCGADFSPLRTYADTKLCNLMLVPLWARRWESSGVVHNAVHPGVLRTALGDRPGAIGRALRLVKRRWEPVERGVPRVVRLTDAALLTTGRYYEEERETPLRPPADDAALAARLWDEAAASTGVPELAPGPAR